MPGNHSKKGVYTGIQVVHLGHGQVPGGCRGLLGLGTKLRHPEPPGCVCHHAKRWQDNLPRDHPGYTGPYPIYPDIGIPEVR